MQTETTRCCIYLFGPLTVVTREADGSWKRVERSAWGSNDFAPNVLKRLLSVPGRRLSRGALLDDVWPGLEGDSLDNYLNRSISLIRKAIGGRDLITTWKGTYEIAGQDQVWVDAEAAEALVTRAENLNDPVAFVPFLEEALALFQRGIYLEQESGAWVHEVRKSYEILFKHCRLWLAEGYASIGKYLQSSLQYQALLQAPWIEEETAQYCRAQQALVEVQAVASRKPVVSLVSPEILYGGLGMDVLAIAWQWKSSFGSISLLQRVFSEVMRKHITMDNAVTRRQALVAIAMFPLQVSGVKLFSAETMLPPSEEILPLCAAGIAACWELRKDQPQGMWTIRDILAAYLPTLEQLARSSSIQQSAAASLVSQGYLLKSVLAGYCGNLEQDKAASRKARLYAQIAQHTDLEIVAMISLANALGDEHRDIKALEIYQEAATLPSFSVVAPLLQGRVYMGLAGKYAISQQSELALSSLDQAREIYSVSPESDPCYASPFAGISSLATWEGITLAYTHRYTEAIDAFSRFGSLTPLPGLPESRRSEHLIYIARIATKQSNLEQASLYLNTAEEIAWNAGHQQRQSEVRETLQEMQQRWPDEPKVKALQEKIDAR